MQKEDKLIYMIKFIVIILCIITILLIIYQFSIERESTQFELIGEKEVILEYGEKYSELGFKATSDGRDISKRVSVISNVNENKIGEYLVEYNLNLKYLNIKDKLVRKVIIRDTIKPKLIINSEKEINLYVDDKYEMPSYEAVDNVDGDISSNVKIESNLNLSAVGIYEINYSVKDSSDNESIEKIVINVAEKPKNAYISISISSQKLWYYEYGNLVLESDVVTGMNNGTPTGDYKVLNKAKNVNLKGTNYVSFVNYWIAFKGNAYGMHDASWRSSFGGNIYKYNGSHGCVNMPYSKVSQLYNLVEIGTPVYIKY